MLFLQDIGQIIGQGLDLKLIDAIGLSEANSCPSQLLDLLKLLGPLLSAPPSGSPLLQEAPEAVSGDGSGGWIGLKEPQGGWLGEILDQGIELGERQVDGCAQLVSHPAHPLLHGHISLHHAVGSPQFGITLYGEKELSLLQEIKDAVGIFLICFADAIMHRLSGISDSLAVHQAHAIAAAFEPLEEGVPVDTRWFHGDEHPFAVMPEHLLPEGALKQSEPLSAVDKRRLPADNACLCANAGTVFGFAHIDSNEQ